MMKMEQLKLALAVAAIAAFTAIPASASTLTFVLNQDGCTGTCGIAPFGTVTLTDNGTGALAFVTVTETMGANERFAGTGALSKQKLRVREGAGVSRMPGQRAQTRVRIK